MMSEGGLKSLSDLISVLLLLVLVLLAPFMYDIAAALNLGG